MFEISQLKEKKLADLQEIAKTLKVPKYRTLKKLDLVYKILDTQAESAEASKEVKIEAPVEEVKPKRARVTREKAIPNVKDNEVKKEKIAVPAIEKPAIEKPAAEKKATESEDTKSDVKLTPMQLRDIRRTKQAEAKKNAPKKEQPQQKNKTQDNNDKFALRLAFSLSTGYLFIIFAFVSKPEFWILMTIYFICQPSYSNSKSLILQRILGTILGLITSFLLINISYFPPPLPLSNILMLLLNCF